ncbi:uncharacterized protein LOC117416766, partial [Acipenser ruthenus]|uniref:uncharacterized protein LOC117416766 n=1 Tax=Acipenser ruthenus TaxID=7906 RepID=UPI0027405877
SLATLKQRLTIVLNYSGTIWVFTAISGLLTLRSDGTIHSANNNFPLMLFGYEKAELQGKVEVSSFSLNLCNSSLKSNTPLLAGNVELIQEEKQRTSAGRKVEIFTGTSTRLENEGSVPSTLSSPAVTSTPFSGLHYSLMKFSTPCLHGTEQTGSMQEPRRASDSQRLNCSLQHQNLPRRSEKREPQTGSTRLGRVVTPQHSWYGISKEGDVKPSAGGCQGYLNGSPGNPTLYEVWPGRQPTLDLLANRYRENSSFEVVFHGSKFPVVSNPVSSLISQESSSYLNVKVESNGNLITQAMQDLDLNGSLELVSPDLSSCSTSEVLRTPSPYMVEHGEGKELLPYSAGLEEAVTTALSDQSGERQCRSLEFEIRKVELPEQQTLFCLWMLRDHLETQREAVMRMKLLLSSLNSTSDFLPDVSGISLGEVIQETARGEGLRCSQDLEDSRACKGESSQKYVTISAVGKGAFGFVWRAQQRTDCEELVAAVGYLRAKNILHRDIKDENIIIDTHFHIKLIDFGSAAFLEPGKLFYTFCGTLEYCSPEVLMGNLYVFKHVSIKCVTAILGMRVLSWKVCVFPFILPPSGTLPKEYQKEERMRLEELLQVPWLSQPINLAEYSWEEVYPARQDSPRCRSVCLMEGEKGCLKDSQTPRHGIYKAPTDTMDPEEDEDWRLNFLNATSARTECFHMLQDNETENLINRSGKYNACHYI